jgi:hypothetical protein
MGEILNPDELQNRAETLGPLNGMELVFVELDTAATPPCATLTVEFFNPNALADIDAAVNTNGDAPTAYFRIRGGARRPGGELPGQVQVTALAPAPGPAPGLALTVTPIGDYSTYTLILDHPLIDPVFAALPFKFRPGCFNLNCHRPPPSTAAPERAPLIDYLARDYASFKHLMIGVMMDRVPGWAPTSEADLDQMLISQLAARADELADKQDRVAAEAFLPRARRRVSLARHARLMDYHVHHGNQATTWLALELAADTTLPATFAVATADLGAAIFQATAERALFARLNALRLYTWDGLVGALDAGATDADLALPAGLDPAAGADAVTLRDALLDPRVGPILIEERLNPDTGRPPGRDPRRRQLLHLTGAEPRFDPRASRWMVRVTWAPEDRLAARFCFVTRCPDQPVVEDVSLFSGNLVEIAHGRPNLTLFTDPDALPDAAQTAAMVALAAAFRAASPSGRVSEAAYEETPWGRLCPLPEGPLAWRDTAPGGEIPPVSTLSVEVEGVAGAWDERVDLIEARESDNAYLVETEHDGRAAIRFGRAPNGEAPPPGSFVVARYQTGDGLAGNVGADTLTRFDAALDPAVLRCWNPFDVTSGRAPESREVILRRAPEAYRARQLRAVTLADYVKRAEELPFVQRAAAAYGWTGSWRTVQVTLDPASATVLSQAQLDAAAAYLNAVRLIGEDLEIRAPDFLPLDIRIRVCAKPSFWPEDLRAELQDAFTEGYTAAGAPGFFHPDNWTFGQSLHASQLVAAAMAVEGVDRVLAVGMRPWDRAGGPTTEIVMVAPEDLYPPEAVRINVAPNQIVRVANDPDALENGRLVIDIAGGRQ